LEISGLIARAVVIVVTDVSIGLFVEKHNIEVSGVIVFDKDFGLGCSDWFLEISWRLTGFYMRGAILFCKFMVWRDFQLNQLFWRFDDDH
jgi:hypothetical protein